MGLDLAGEVGIHGGLGSRADSNRPLQVRLATLGNPGDLGSKTLNMLLLSLQVVRTNEDWEVGISDFECFDLRVEPGLDVFPDGIRGGFENVASGNIVV